MSDFALAQPRLYGFFAGGVLLSEFGAGADGVEDGADA
jgi:hypothetical protein